MCHWSLLLGVRTLKYIITYLLHNLSVFRGHSGYIFSFCVPAVNYNLADLAGYFISSECCRVAAVLRAALLEVMIHRVHGDVGAGSNIMW